MNQSACLPAEKTSSEHPLPSSGTCYWLDGYVRLCTYSGSMSLINCIRKLDHDLHVCLRSYSSSLAYNCQVLCDEVLWIPRKTAAKDESLNSDAGAAPGKGPPRGCVTKAGLRGRCMRTVQPYRCIMTLVSTCSDKLQNPCRSTSLSYLCLMCPSQPLLSCCPVLV